MSDAERVAFAARPESTGNVRASRPMTGAEFLESLRDGREVYIYGERVKDETTHPAFCTTPSTRTSSWSRPTPAAAA
jgi:hypothetical protein